jgi:hypothetical protein
MKSIKSTCFVNTVLNHGNNFRADQLLFIQVCFSLYDKLKDIAVFLF